MLTFFFFGTGALAKEHVAQGLPPVIGSTMVVRFKSVEEVRAWLSVDIYAREGVWDVENAIVNAVSILVLVVVCSVPLDLANFLIDHCYSHQ